MVAVFNKKVVFQPQLLRSFVRLC